MEFTTNRLLLKWCLKMHDVNFFGEGAVFDHVGLVVASIQQAVPDAQPTVDTLQRVSVEFVNLHGIRTELIEPLNVESPVQKNLEEGRPLAHLCFRVPDLDVALVIGRQKGFHLIGKPVAAPAFGNQLIAWVFSRVYGLFELVESRE